MKNKPLLVIKNLTICSDKQTLVDNISFDINKGEVLALVGASGSGKTLTALSILQLLPNKLHCHANYLYQGKNLNNLDISTIRGREIAFIFQDSHHAINPVFTLGNQLLETLMTHENLHKSQAIKKVKQWLNIVQLDEQCYDKYSYELSGGQKQRIMIAMALISGAKLIIADEPTTALDVSTQKEILLLLTSLKKKYQLSILFITHDLSVVKVIADRVIVLQSGKVLANTKINDFFTHSRQPYIASLLNVLSAKPSLSLPTKTSNPLLQLDDIGLKLPIKSGFFRRTTGFNQILSGISFELNEGENLAIVGESGSGKTSIALLIMRQIKANTGKLSFRQTNINQLGKIDYACCVQIIFQQVAHSFNPRQTLLDTLLEGMNALKISQAGQTHQVYLEQLFNEVGLDKALIESLPHQLSGGQLQRVAIVRALCVNPSIIICDEPTSSLDNTTKKQVLDLLLSLQKTRHISYIFITHDMSAVRYFSDRVLVLQSGQMVESGLTSQVLNQPNNPYTKMLLESIL